jgi:nucleoside-diphosphate-sugar epimerase
MRVLVTGCNSFIGRHLLSELRRAGHQVFGTIRNQHETPPPDDVPVFTASLTSPSEWITVMKEVRPDCVIHLAAVALVTHADQAELYATNVIGTEFVLKAIGEVPGLRPHLILASTAGVYGNQKPSLLDESLPLRPANHYAMSKLAMEYLAQQYADLYPIRIIRPFNVVGPGQSDTFLMPKLVKHFVQQAQQIPLGNVKPERDYIDVRDFVAVVSRLLEHVPTELDVVNICSGEGTSVEQLVQWLAELTQHRPQITVNPAFVRKNEVWRMVGDNRKVLKLVNYKLKYTVHDALKWMVEDARSAAARTGS